MKKAFAMGATAVFMMTALAGCGTQSAGQSNNVGATDANQATSNTSTASDTTSSEPTLVLATSADYKPYEYHDTSGGGDKIVGFDIDVANAIAKQLHFKIKIEDMNFDGLIGALQAHRADFVIAGMTPTPAREKNVDFSDLYYQATNVVLTKKGTNVTSLDQLKGDKVAAQLGSIQETAAKAIPGVTVDSIDTIPDVVQEVVTNRAKAAIIEDTVATGYVKANNQLQINKIAGLASNGSAIAFPKGSPWTTKFNTAIQKMKSDGELQTLEQKWFGN